MANNKLTFDFGQPPNFDGLSEQKLIAHSVNVESLPDGSGVRTRSGMKHAYQFRTYSDTTSESTQIMSGLRTPNVENVNGNEVGLDIIYSIDENGKYIIKDMKQTIYVQTDDQDVTFTHVENEGNDYPQILVYTDGNEEYYLMLNRLSGSKKVEVSYKIGLIEYEGQTVTYNRSVLNYRQGPPCIVDKQTDIINGTLIINTQSGEFMRSVDSFSIVGNATLNPQDAFVKIPIPWPLFEANDDDIYDMANIANIPITLSFRCYEDNKISLKSFVRTNNLKTYPFIWVEDDVNPVIRSYPSGQSGLVSFFVVYSGGKVMFRYPIR